MCEIQSGTIGYDVLNTFGKINKVLNPISNVSLLVMACVAAAGIFPGAATLGYVMVGLGAGLGLIEYIYLLIKNSSNNKAKEQFSTKTFKILMVLSTLSLVTVGVIGGLGIAGILTSTYMGYAYLGAFAAFVIPSFGIGFRIGYQQSKSNPIQH